MMRKNLIVLVSIIFVASCIEEYPKDDVNDFENESLYEYSNEETPDMVSDSMENEQQENPDNKMKSLVPRGYYAQDRLWEEDDISLCFQPSVKIDEVLVPSDATDEDRQFVRKVVTETWQKVSSMSFSGWNVCDDEIYDVYIWLDSRYPIGHTYGWGENNKGHHMELITGTKSHSVYTILHEFGHILGFIHEHARPNTLCPKYEDKVTKGFTTFGAHDFSSVMHNRCGELKPHLSDELSPIDIDTVIDMYGTYISGKFSGWGDDKFTITMNDDIPVVLSKQGRYEIRDVLLELGDRYSLSTDSLDASQSCFIRHSSEKVGHDNAGNVDISCYDHEELSSIILQTLLF